MYKLDADGVDLNISEQDQAKLVTLLDHRFNRWIFLIEREGGWALPGGHANQQTLVRITVDGIFKQGHFPPVSVSGHVDTKRAAWIMANDYKSLCGYLRDMYQGVAFPAHVEMLRDALGEPF